MKPKTRSSTAVLSGAALLATSLVTTASPTATATSLPATGAETSAAGVRLDATLRGGAGGDPDGRGHAVVRLYRAAGRVCADVTWTNIGAPTAAHIHRKSDGAVRVGLSGSVTGGAKCTTGVRPKLIKRIVNHPRRYYFNVHNGAYPAGAISGTLHR